MPRFTHFNSHIQVGTGADAYVVALRDGQLPVNEYDQGCAPWDCGERLVSLADAESGPRWGRGWTVLDTAGTERWFASNWDSSG